jgi:hypothetical protein
MIIIIVQMLFEIPGKPQGLCFVALRVVVLGSEALKLFRTTWTERLTFPKNYRSIGTILPEPN